MLSCKRGPSCLLRKHLRPPWSERLRIFPGVIFTMRALRSGVAGLHIQPTKSYITPPCMNSWTWNVNEIPKMFWICFCLFVPHLSPCLFISPHWCRATSEITVEAFTLSASDFPPVSDFKGPIFPNYRAKTFPKRPADSSNDTSVW